MGRICRYTHVIKLKKKNNKVTMKLAIFLLVTGVCYQLSSAIPISNEENVRLVKRSPEPQFFGGFGQQFGGGGGFGRQFGGGGFGRQFGRGGFGRGGFGRSFGGFGRGRGRGFGFGRDGGRLITTGLVIGGAALAGGLIGQSLANGK